MRFKAELVRPDGSGTWTYVTVPFDTVKTFGKKGRIPVSATIGGAVLRSSLMPHGDGRHYLVVPKPIRDALDVTAGDTVSVELSEDKAPRVVEVPDDFATALRKKKAAAQYFESLAPSHRKEYVRWIEEAKREETRVRRIEKAITMLAEKKRLK